MISQHFIKKIIILYYFKINKHTHNVGYDRKREGGCEEGGGGGNELYCKGICVGWVKIAIISFPDKKKIPSESKFRIYAPLLPYKKITLNFI